MKNQLQLHLFLVSNPVPFSRYEDHQAALQIQLHELVEQALAEKEDPRVLIEQYLGVPYNEGDTAQDMALFIQNSPQMSYALSELKENWSRFDDSIPAESLTHASVKREDAVEAYSEITLRSYLEALCGVYDNL